MKTLNIKKNFLAIDEQYSNLENSAIVILPAPYEQTTSYGKGAEKGPKAILNASSYVEFFDEEFLRELCFEVGIATLKPISFKKLKDLNALKIIEEKVDLLLAMNKFVVTLGGEHTISLAPIKSHYKKYPNMSILQFDAHSDLREEYENTPYSHASVMARVCEFFPPHRITQVGIRALCKEEENFIKQNSINTFYAFSIRNNSYGNNWQEKVIDTLQEEIYITFDVDYFDPSLMPATGTPEPYGFFYDETLALFRKIKSSGRKIIGFDVVELAPIKKLHHPNLTVARLIYKLLNIVFS